MLNHYYVPRGFAAAAVCSSTGYTNRRHVADSLFQNPIQCQAKHACFFSFASAARPWSTESDMSTDTITFRNVFEILQVNAVSVLVSRLKNIFSFD